MSTFTAVFDSQKTLFASDVTRTYEWRFDQLDRMEKLIVENESALRSAIAADFKTASQEYIFETGATLGEAQYQKSQLKQWMEPTQAPVPTFLAQSGHTAVVHRDPYGVALIIAPFNGPLLLVLRPALTALAAGNTCILKLSEQLPNTSTLLMDLIPRYFDSSAVAAVRGNREQVTELLALPFDFIFFTGSTKVGKIVMRAAAEHLTPVVLELGGQNPVLVDETADIRDAAKKIVWGATAWGGQWCTSPGYAYVQESVAEQFVAEARKALVELYGESPKTNPDYSRVINAREVSRLAALIDPSKVVAGGNSDPAEHYIDPTLLYPVTWNDPIMEEEVFGPILPILTYKTFDEALACIKAKPDPLAAYIFSRDQKRIDDFLGRLSFGGGAVNQVNVHLFVESMPFGGTGASGVGHYYGKYGFDMLTHAKSILVAPSGVTIDHLLPPYSDEKNSQLGKWFEY
ncbi:aldehyde dehydrogenase family protein [Pseudomonas gingeri]|uniref:aldehyde dehydrogenase family protein n=1 Tax=Pseudomonas gingeri TaxID=117681 RepID=UPI0015A3E826|nr:aldehyde dehydrogenase family protein [Pseudomonas gingeri]NWA29764.1 aldehyde dehydrogenase family protein [Pseudomonas gingeri]